MVDRQYSSLVVRTPLGTLLAVGSQGGLCSLTWIGERSEDQARLDQGVELGGVVLDESDPGLESARRQLDAYFHGSRKAFSLDLSLSGSPFQMRVWSALQRIPFGRTRSYGEVARYLGRPRSSRAVAQACGANPVAVLVPCHRVVEKGGALGGYSAGVEVKGRLLRLEREGSAALPLFAVADAREETERRDASQRRFVEETLPPELAGWLDAQERGLARGGVTPDRWLQIALEQVPADQTSWLAAVLASRAARSGDDVLVDMAREVIQWAAADVRECLPAPGGLLRVLRACLAVESPEFGLLVRELMTRPDLPRDLYDVLRDVLEGLLGGDLPAGSYQREQAVDLWVDLRSMKRSDPMMSHLVPDPSGVLEGAGLWREAAVTLEGALRRGDGRRQDVLQRLVDLYELLGDERAAYDRLVALAAEDPAEETVKRLRAMRERISSH
ncbi:MAG: methylated-DNA--[protein]-cysteine S-methyltransferase [Myxococcota bacterium]|nr:methylated-DNA--[protein]-cysteine S-methyltransferase [Myxococcota bacterium]